LVDKWAAVVHEAKSSEANTRHLPEMKAER
jgi:hypothetical protein